MISIRLIRRVIWGWQDWRYQNKLEKIIPGYRERREELFKAKRQHRPTQALYREQRDAMSRLLTRYAGRSR